MKHKHTIGYYVLWAGYGIILLNLIINQWPIWVSYMGFGISTLGLGLGYIEIKLRNKKK